MNRFLPNLILLLTLTALCPAAQREDLLSKARARAKKENKDIAVLYHGSAWCPAGKTLKDLWDESAFEKSVKNLLLVAEVDPTDIASDNDESDEDSPNGRDEALAKKMTQELRKNFRPSNYPAIVFYDKDGRTIATKQGLNITSQQQLTRLLQDAQAQRIKRDEFWAKAAKASGAAKARLIGQGLDATGAPRPIRRPRRRVPANSLYRQLEAMRKADPKDTTGYLRRYSFDPGGTLSAITKAHPGKITEQLDAVEAQLSHPHNPLLRPSQLQELCIRAFSIARKSKSRADVERGYAILERGRALDPASNYGIGCAGMILMDRGPASLRQGIQPRHLKKNTTVSLVLGEKPELESLQPLFPRAGTYRLVVTYRKGRNSLIVSNAILRAGQTVLATNRKSATLNTKTRSVEFALDVKHLSTQSPLTLTLSAKASGGTYAVASLRLVPPGK